MLRKWHVTVDRSQPVAFGAASVHRCGGLRCVPCSRAGGAVRPAVRYSGAFLCVSLSQCTSRACPEHRCICGPQGCVLSGGWGPQFSAILSQCSAIFPPFCLSRAHLACMSSMCKYATAHNYCRTIIFNVAHASELTEWQLPVVQALLSHGLRSTGDDRPPCQTGLYAGAPSRLRHGHHLGGPQYS